MIGLSSIFTFVVILAFGIGSNAQTTDNTDVCLHADANGAFDTAWCTKLTRTEGCRLGIVNLLFAAAEGDTAALKRYHASGMNMSLADYDHRTAVHLTAAEGHLEATKFLLEEAHVSPSPKDRWGNHPLDEALRFKRTDVATYLHTFTAMPKAIHSEPNIQSYEEEEYEIYI